MTRPRVSVFLLAVVAVPGAADLVAQQVPDGFARVDHDIRIGVLPGRLRFDLEAFAVGPGSKVKLTFVNVDEMQHNLLICKPGEKSAQRPASPFTRLRMGSPLPVFRSVWSISRFLLDPF